MNDAHEELMDLFRAYFKVNQSWEAKQTHAAGMDARKLLSDIRRAASARREEIQAVRAVKPKIKSPKIQAITFKRSIGH